MQLQRLWMVGTGPTMTKERFAAFFQQPEPTHVEVGSSTFKR